MTLTDVFSLRDADVDGVMAKHGPGVTDGAPANPTEDSAFKDGSSQSQHQKLELLMLSPHLAAFWERFGPIQNPV